MKVIQEEYQPSIFFRKDAAEEILEHIPIYRQCKRLMRIIDQNDGLKLTSTGNLPPVVVKDIYSFGSKDELIETGITKLCTENDSRFVQMSHYVLVEAKVVKKRKGVLTLTKSGKQLLENPSELVYRLFYTACFEFNLSFSDFYPDEMCMLCFYPEVFLRLLKKFGGQKETLKFYVKAYVEATGLSKFHMFDTSNQDACNSFRLRMINLLFNNFGLLELENPYNINPDEVWIRKSVDFDDLVIEYDFV